MATSSGIASRAVSPKSKRSRIVKDAKPQDDDQYEFPFNESDDLIRYPELEGDVDLRKRWYM